MEAVVDSSTLISLAWAGLLGLVAVAPVDLVVPEAVYRETVVDGLARGHPDAAAVDGVVTALRRVPAAGGDVGDTAVLDAGRSVGVLLTNDRALGRRAANLGVRWLRTADLVLLCVRAGTLDRAAGRAALAALRETGRITDDLRAAYEEELR